LVFRGKGEYSYGVRMNNKVTNWICEIMRKGADEYANLAKLQISSLENFV